MILLSLLFLVAKPAMNDFIGINTHTVQFKPDLYRPVASLIRNYHPVAWDLGDHLTAAPHFPMTENGVSWKELYGTWKAAGYRTEASAQVESIPAKYWTDVPKQAFSYGEAFARYFGPSGENKFLEAVEIGNEPAEFSETLYRSVFENMAKGLRAGDPKLKILPCAINVGKDDKYSKDLASLAGLEKYIDVLNVHTYAFKEYWPTWKRSYPEDPKIVYLKQIQNIIDWRNIHAPGKSIWVTEFGYDSTTKPNKSTGDFKDWKGNTDAEQARYIVRSYLVMSAMDVDRAYLYWFNDEDEPSLHASSGLTRHFQPKPSFHAVAHMRKSLGNLKFLRALVASKDDAYVYEYGPVSGNGDHLLVAWSPTGSGRIVKSMLPKVNGKPVRAERMPMKEGLAEAVPYEIVGGQIKLTLTEDPTYIWIQ